MMMFGGYNHYIYYIFNYNNDDFFNHYIYYFFNYNNDDFL